VNWWSYVILIAAVQFFETHCILLWLDWTVKLMCADSQLSNSSSVIERLRSPYDLLNCSRHTVHQLCLHGCRVCIKSRQDNEPRSKRHYVGGGRGCARRWSHLLHRIHHRAPNSDPCVAVSLQADSRLHFVKHGMADWSVQTEWGFPLLQLMPETPHRPDICRIVSIV